MPNLLRSLLIAASLLLFCQPRANAGVYDFESFSDGDLVTNQLPGATFTNAVILTAGISLNEFEFPPHSGFNVVSDNGGPITILFSSPVLSFGGYFTYAETLTLQAFDAGSNLIGSASSAFTNNMALSGDVGSSPNEFLQLNFAGGISTITITGDLLGGSFAMDDVSNTPATSATPEPSSALLWLTGLLGLGVVHKRLSL